MTQIGVNDSVLLTTDELLLIRNSMIGTVAKLDKIIGKRGKYSKTREVKKYVSIDYILKGVCGYYKISLEQLLCSRRLDGIVQRKKFAIKLLMDYTGSTLDEVADALGYGKDKENKRELHNKHCIIRHHLHDVNDMLSEEFYGNNGAKETYRKLLSYLEL